MGAMFSSPSKQATAAAKGSQGISSQDIQQIEKYTQNQQAKLRGAISGLGPNPYFSAGSAMGSPTQMSPTNMVNFGPSASTPGGNYLNSISSGIPGSGTGTPNPFLGPNVVAQNAMSPQNSMTGNPIPTVPGTGPVPTPNPTGGAAPGSSAVPKPGTVPPGLVTPTNPSGFGSPFAAINPGADMHGSFGSNGIPL